MLKLQLLLQIVVNESMLNIPCLILKDKVQLKVAIKFPLLDLNILLLSALSIHVILPIT